MDISPYGEDYGYCDFSWKINEENDQSVGVQFFYCNTSQLPKQRIHKLIGVEARTRSKQGQDITARML